MYYDLRSTLWFTTVPLLLLMMKHFRSSVLYILQDSIMYHAAKSVIRNIWRRYCSSMLLLILLILGYTFSTRWLLYNIRVFQKYFRPGFSPTFHRFGMQSGSITVVRRCYQLVPKIED